MKPYATRHGEFRAREATEKRVLVRPETLSRHLHEPGAASLPPICGMRNVDGIMAG